MGYLVEFICFQMWPCSTEKILLVRVISFHFQKQNQKGQAIWGLTKIIYSSVFNESVCISVTHKPKVLKNPGLQISHPRVLAWKFWSGSTANDIMSLTLHCLQNYESSLQKKLMGWVGEGGQNEYVVQRYFSASYRR